MNTEQEREALKKHYGALFDLTETPDEWGNPRFAHESVEAIWYGWRDRAALQSQDREDAERYRYLRNEAWGCNKNKPTDMHVVLIGAGVLRSALTELAENALDEAIDHARRVEGGAKP